jgi:hypothetical protein
MFFSPSSSSLALPSNSMNSFEGGFLGARGAF